MDGDYDDPGHDDTHKAIACGHHPNVACHIAGEQPPPPPMRATRPNRQGCPAAL